jgi:protein Tex
MLSITRYLASELSIDENQVVAVLRLFEEDATIPFIARYRKERTGGLEEDTLRTIRERYQYLVTLEERKQTILESIDEQGKLTDELKVRIQTCTKLQELEDLYLPYRPKRKTRATVAIAKGLEPLARFILDNPAFEGNFEEKLAEFLDEEKEVYTTAEALQGAKDIIAEMISDSADVRKSVREYIIGNSIVRSEKVEDKKQGKEKKSERKDVYQLYYDFHVDIKNIKPYQTLALNRGEREKALKVLLEFDTGPVMGKIKSTFFSYKKTVFVEILDEVVQDAFSRLIRPSIEREIRNTLTEEADAHAIEVFASNLRQLLLQPPLSRMTIMGIDPGFVSGSKVAVIDNTGKYLDGMTIYPHPPQNKMREAIDAVVGLVNTYAVDIIAIGNGTAGRETELMIAEMIREHNLSCKYIIVSEAGASVYSASKLAKEEFPDLEASMRGNISIARRVLDPLAELIKIDPKSIGVGLYQHDVNQKQLMEKLDQVVESCVNYVGVDVNTASVPLLTYVSGLNKRIAGNIVSHREKTGRFTDRLQFLDVSGVGEKVFEQAAGFLKVPGSNNPFDNTFIHPESYDATNRLLELLNIPLHRIKESVADLDRAVGEKDIGHLAQGIGIGEPTMRDIIENLKRPGRDPREELPKPILRSDVLKIEDLKEGMKLKGTVRNVTDFGAFVDIGVKESGLLHISQMAERFVKNPLDVVQVGDIIDVTIIGIDLERGRISLSRKGNAAGAK